MGRGDQIAAFRRKQGNLIPACNLHQVNQLAYES